jgi:transposase-like protein
LFGTRLKVWYAIPHDSTGREGQAQRVPQALTSGPGPTSDMVIVTDFGRSVQGYVDHFVDLIFSRPAVCPHCQRATRIIGHGFYRRKVLGLRDVYLIRIKRWYCTVCGHTISLLPSFLLRFRQYALEVIYEVVVTRFELGLSWKQVIRRCSYQGEPSGRTIQRWCYSFAQQAARWWAAVQAELAEYDSGSPGLDPFGVGTSEPSAPRVLLQAAVHLLAWAKTLWPEVVDYGLNDRLCLLWQWGYAKGLGRLI